MHDTFPLLENTGFPLLRRDDLATLQVNLGYRCNQQCLHCHVNAGPNRKEMMGLDTVNVVLEYLARSKVPSLDLTGGAPELNPHFRYLVRQAHKLGTKIIDRCNLTILNESQQADLDRFLADHAVEITASLPCYQKQNVDQQRGQGVFEGSIEGLKKLNALGYGAEDSGLILNLVYNPVGPVLPPPQKTLESDYKKELAQHFGIKFNNLYTLANMPIKRFGSMLVSKGEFNRYMQLLRSAFNAENLAGVMCRSLISVDWQGYVYDCDFNQMLNLPMKFGTIPKVHLKELIGKGIKGNTIAVLDHCYGCTAGQGSSCGGALV